MMGALFKEDSFPHFQGSGTLRFITDFSGTRLQSVGPLITLTGIRFLEEFVP
jgi:hypothetical protein